MADVTTLAESAQAIFCAYADYVGESKAQEKLNIKTYPTFDSFALKERKDLEAAIKGVDVDAPAKEIFEFLSQTKNGWYQSSITIAKTSGNAATRANGARTYRKNISPFP